MVEGTKMIEAGARWNRRRLIRFTLLFCLAPISSAAAIVGVTTGAANACDTSDADHCYGIVHGYDSPDIRGDTMTVDPQCLGAATGQYGTIEMWLADPYKDWIETGYAANGSGETVGGLGPGTWRFWAESKPGSSFVAHSFGHFPPLVSTDLSLVYSGSDEFQIVSNNDIAYSTNNSMAPHEATYGGETTANSGNAIYGYVTASGYYDSNGYHHSGGIPHRTTRVDSPETFSWVQNYSTFNAGEPCVG